MDIEEPYIMVSLCLITDLLAQQNSQAAAAPLIQIQMAGTNEKGESAVSHPASHQVTYKANKVPPSTIKLPVVAWLLNICNWSFKNRVSRFSICPTSCFFTCPTTCADFH